MVKSKNENGSNRSQRQLRVGELIRRTMSEILSRGEIHDPDLNRLYISVSEVTVSPDLRIATAYVMPLGGQNYDAAIERLAKNKGELRTIIGRKAKLKFAPDLRFRIDETFDRMQETRELFERDDIKRDITD